MYWEHICETNTSKILTVLKLEHIMFWFLPPETPFLLIGSFCLFPPTTLFVSSESAKQSRVFKPLCCMYRFCILFLFSMMTTLNNKNDDDISWSSKGCLVRAAWCLCLCLVTLRIFTNYTSNWNQVSLTPCFPQSFSSTLHLHKWSDIGVIDFAFDNFYCTNATLQQWLWVDEYLDRHQVNDQTLPFDSLSVAGCQSISSRIYLCA